MLCRARIADLAGGRGYRRGRRKRRPHEAPSPGIRTRAPSAPGPEAEAVYPACAPRDRADRGNGRKGIR